MKDFIIFALMFVVFATTALFNDVFITPAMMSTAETKCETNGGLGVYSKDASGTHTAICGNGAKFVYSEEKK